MEAYSSCILATCCLPLYSMVMLLKHCGPGYPSPYCYPLSGRSAFERNPSGTYHEVKGDHLTKRIIVLATCPQAWRTYTFKLPFFGRKKVHIPTLNQVARPVKVSPLLVTFPELGARAWWRLLERMLPETIAVGEDLRITRQGIK